MNTQGLLFTPPVQYQTKGKVSFDVMMGRIGPTAYKETKIREIIREGLTPNAPKMTFEGRVVKVGKFGDLVGSRWLFDSVQIQALKEAVGLKQASLEMPDLGAPETAISGEKFECGENCHYGACRNAECTESVEVPLGQVEALIAKAEASGGWDIDVGVDTPRAWTTFRALEKLASTLKGPALEEFLGVLTDLALNPKFNPEPSAEQETFQLGSLWETAPKIDLREIEIKRALQNPEIHKLGYTEAELRDILQRPFKGGIVYTVAKVGDGLNRDAPPHKVKEGEALVGTVQDYLGKLKRTNPGIAAFGKDLREGMEKGNPFEGLLTEPGALQEATKEFANLKEYLSEMRATMTKKRASLAQALTDGGYPDLAKDYHRPEDPETYREPVKVDSDIPTIGTMVKLARQAVDLLPQVTVTRRGPNFSLTLSGTDEEELSADMDQGFALVDQIVNALERYTQANPNARMSVNGVGFVEGSEFDILIRE